MRCSCKTIRTSPAIVVRKYVAQSHVRAISSDIIGHHFATEGTFMLTRWPVVEAEKVFLPSAFGHAQLSISAPTQREQPGHNGS
jgi:hypothetical protein